MGTYRLIAGSAAEAFHNSRAKVRLYGGGFANGKTTALVADTLKVARDYPGCNILMARESYPKLNSTLRREFIKWCPPSWIKSFDKSKENTCQLKNGTTIDFRYIDQSNNADGEGTSNLLSANYDYIAVDQIDDVGITYEDFLQLLGRLRGSATYQGDDETMPRTGPRMIALSCNPTLGWPYQRLVKPLHDFRNGTFNPDLICERDEKGDAIFVDGRPTPLISVHEASTYDNAQNLAPDYIKLLEATYTGKMRERYLLGRWVAFDGVVYDEFDSNLHVVPRDAMREYMARLRMAGERQGVAEGYDFGLVVPSVYLLSLVDADGNLHIVDGFYEPNMSIADQAKRIHALRDENCKGQVWVREPEVRADPSIFRRIAGSRSTVSKTIAGMFTDEGIRMVPGDNDIMRGIVKVKSYLIPQQSAMHPYYQSWGAPKLFISDHLHWLVNEFQMWRWKRNRNDQSIDKTVDTNDHAMDALKYLVSKQPQIGYLVATGRPQVPMAVRKWNESEAETSDRRSHRHRRW